MMGKREQKIEICSYFTSLRGICITWGYNHHHSSSRIYFGSISANYISRRYSQSQKDLMLEPLAGSCYHDESGF